ncbi:helix-turn-helix domain-containing protein, partial [Synechococcus sp. PCC 7336]
QQQLADAVELHVNQIKNYESGSGQPTLSSLVKLAKTLHISLDDLVFEGDERGPDEQLKLQFEAIRDFDEEDKALAKGLLEGLILRHAAKQSMLRQAASQRELASQS